MPSTPTDPAAGPVNSTALLSMLHLSDSALPTGGFAHSFGLETYLQRDLVNSPETYRQWLHAYLRQASYNDALIARLAADALAHPLAEAQEKLRELDALAHATLVPRQVREANKSMGRRMCKIIAIVVPDHPLADWYVQQVQEGTLHGCPALAHGLALAAAGLDTGSTVRSYLIQLAASLTQNAIRGIPIGQDAGQRVLVSSYPVIEECVQTIAGLGLLDVGATAPGLEVAQMHHEGQRARMFMS
ncbi:MAG TPA: urease accessory UreF family protein [Corynebacterium sp.]|nr:urease accessory UreF family protein [Corynebacterium sp.]